MKTVQNLCTFRVKFPNYIKFMRGGAKYCLVNALLFLLMLSSNSLQSQVSDPPIEDQCVVLGQANYPQALENANCPFTSVLPNDLSSLPIVTINVNIHFIKHNSYPDGNFIPLGTNNFDWNNGDNIAQQLINGCNSFAANATNNPLNDLLSYPNYIGDTKFRLRIVSDPNNPADLHNGVWYWPSKPSVFPNPNVMNIVITDNNSNSVNGDTDWDANYINLYNLYRFSYLNSAHWWNYRRLIWHELGHAYGHLCHSFETQGQCANIDINTPAECGLGSGNSNCGNTDKPNCDNWSTLSNNIMGYNGKEPWAISPCQWKGFYSGIYRTFHESTIDFCTQEQSPIYIQSGQFVEWETLKLLNRHVIVQTGGQLTISCEVRMGEEKTIQVQRGAKLIVNGGTIRNLCYGKRWGGIYVEGNNSLAQCSPGSFPSASQSGVVFVKNNARIEKAADAIITAKFGELWNESMWGGLVYAENSAFVNNRRAISFMKYDIQNKSQIRHCIINESGAFDNSTGVTIWHCKGILFENNNIGPIDKQAIYGIDMGIDVLNSNNIHNCNRGIEGVVTTPVTGNNISITGTPIANVFQNNTEYDVYMNGTELAGDLRVEKNNFQSGSNTTFVSILTTGNSTYKIFDNIFDKRTVGVSANQGKESGFIYCNTYNNTPNAIQLSGDNSHTLFYVNQFNSNGNNVAILAQSGQGIVFNPQTSTPADPLNYLASDNCFNSINSNDIFAQQGLTAQFRYLRQSDAPNLCLLPNNNLSDGGTNNYTLELANAANQACSGPFIVGVPPTETEYVTWYNYTHQLEMTYNANLSSNVAADNFHFADLKLRQLRSALVDNAIDSLSFTAANNALATETSPIALKMKLGLALAQKNYTQAQIIVNQLPLVTQDDQYFKYTQQVNLDINQIPWSTPLDATQLSMLNTIANSMQASKVYARGILALKTGAEWSPDPAEVFAGSENRSSGSATTDVEQSWTLAPNPAQNILKLHRIISDEHAEISIIDIQGNVVLTQSLEEKADSKTIDISVLHAGLYIIKIEESQNAVRFLKFIKN